MPTVSHQPLSSNTLRVEVTIPQSEYAQKLESELKKVAKQIEIKGFRKGQAPMSLVKGRYGDSILSDLIVDEFSKAMDEMIKEQGLNTFGRPLPADDCPVFDPRINKLGDYSFIYEVGHIPPFELGGMDKTFPLYKFEFPESEVDKEIASLKKRYGSTNVAEAFEGDSDTFYADIALFDEAGNAIELEKPINDVLFMVRTIENETLKAQVLAAKAGFSFDFVVSDFSYSEDMFRKHVLRIDDDNFTFAKGTATIKSIMVFADATLDKETLNQLFGEEVNSEDDVRNLIRESMNLETASRANVELRNQVMISIMENTKIDMPIEFMEKVIENNPDNKSITDVKGYVRDNLGTLVWLEIREQVQKSDEVYVTEQEIRSQVAREINQYYQFGANEQMVNTLVTTMMKDKDYTDRIYSSILDAKVGDVCAAKVATVETPIEMAEFDKINKESQARFQSLLSAPQTDEVEVETV